jgi:thiamine pyrophosphate-dependent acetolactate synthase large subunit-like protein
VNLVRIATWSEVPDRVPTATSELRSALAAAFAYDHPALVEVMTDAELV